MRLVGGNFGMQGEEIGAMRRTKKIVRQKILQEKNISFILAYSFVLV